ncbi:MAG: hemerythrin domain-containing protein [Cryomorphaceae bacterium]|nr:hemerythrin domain-containing protein [Flavobacteriales bacterium]
MQSTAQISGDLHVAKIRARYELSSNNIADNDRDAFIEELLICLNDPRSATPDAFEIYGISTLVDFLTKSHAFYLEYAIPSIQRSINELLRTHPENRVLRKVSEILMQGFISDLENHFIHEENYLFKYALRLSSNPVSLPFPYSIDQFRKEHGAFLVDIDKVIAFFEMYQNDLSDNMAYRMVVQQLANLKADMDLHGLIEDEVLLPKIEKLES